MTLERLVRLVPHDRLITPADPAWRALDIADLAFDSRQAGPSTVFFALPGTHTDGHRFLDDVAARGCRAVVVSRLPEAPRPDTLYAVVADPRAALSPWSSALFGHPSQELFVLGITGTDGKSSTVSYVHQLLTLAGEKAGFFSTVEWNDGTGTHHNAGRQSTPEAPQVHGILRQMVTAGCRFAVLESTSHGLSPKTSRLADVAYAAAAYTNVTTEHLEFHGTLENYRADKARLFGALGRGRSGAFGVVNLDDPHHGLFQSAAGAAPVLSYSLADPGASLRLEVLAEEPDGLRLMIHQGDEERPVRLNIPGRFNASNLGAALLTAAGALTLAGRPTTALDLVPLAAQLKAVKGRMVPVRQGQPFAVLVDYAHTPGAFEALMPAVKAVTPGRLLAVFGSGGERDPVKRPLQGAVADQWCDFVVFTDEDPRLEDPEAILADLARGVTRKAEGQGFWRIRPRQAAVAHALGLAREGDTVLLLGKGHEQTLVTAAGPEPYDEETVARQALAALGWDRP